MTKINKEDILEALYEEIIEEMAEKIANDMIYKAVTIYEGIKNGDYKLLDREGGEVSI